MTSYQGLRKRVAAVERDVSLSDYRPSMHKDGLYFQIDDPSNRWIDENGFEHIDVPAKPTSIGRNLGAPYTEIIDDIL